MAKAAFRRRSLRDRHELRRVSARLAIESRRAGCSRGGGGGNEGPLAGLTQADGNIASAPMSYSVDGKQYVALAAGNVLYSFAFPN
jgi:hypothetical protein